MLTVFEHPSEVPGGIEFMDRHACALRWTTGLFTHWHWVPPVLASGWRFVALADEGGLSAIALNQKKGHWWGLVARDTLAAIEVAKQMGPVRFLEGDEEHVFGVLEACPRLSRAVVETEDSTVLSRSTQALTGTHPSGFRTAQYSDVQAFRRYHRDNPGQARTPTANELRVQVDLGTLFVVEHEHRIASLARVMPAGSFRYLSDVFTFPKYRRRGHARTLIEGLLVTLARGGHGACLCVSSDNAAALNLYSQMGFEHAGVRLQVRLGLS